MSFTGNQKNSRLNTIYDKANGAVQVGFPTITLAANSIIANSNTDILNIRGAGFTVTTNTNQRILTIATNSDLLVSQNSALLAANTWTRYNSDISATPVNDLVWSPELGLFAAVSTTGAGEVWTSTTGYNWIKRTCPSNTWRCITWSPELGLFAAAGLSGTPGVMTSPDGITWTSRATPVNIQWQDILWCKELGLFVAVAWTGTANQVMYSSDGINWAFSATPSPTKNWRGMTWSKELGLLVAVGYDPGQNVMTSPDGITWTLRSTSVFLNLNTVAWSPELRMFAAHGDNNNCYSYDGITWTIVEPGFTALNLSKMVWVPQFRAFVLTAGNITTGTAGISYDGINFTVLTVPDGQWSALDWSPELGILLAGSNSNLGDNVMTSRPVGLWGAINTRLTRQQVMSRISLGV